MAPFQISRMFEKVRIRFTFEHEPSQISPLLQLEARILGVPTQVSLLSSTALMGWLGSKVTQSQSNLPHGGWCWEKMEQSHACSSEEEWGANVLNPEDLCEPS